MYNTTKVKTYQPILPAGKGPICMNAADAVRDMIMDLDDKIPTEEDMTVIELEKFVHTIVKGLDISDWIDGEYTMFEDYKLIVHTYQQGQLDKMGEFSGY